MMAAGSDEGSTGVAGAGRASPLGQQSVKYLNFVNGQSKWHYNDSRLEVSVSHFINFARTLFDC